MTGSAPGHLDIGHLTDDLSGRSVRSGLMMAAAESAHLLLNVGSTIVLSRLLIPSDFGLMAMVTAVSSFLALFLDLGLGSATVQHTDLRANQLSGLFWLNVAIGVAVAGAMASTAPLVASFYDRPELEAITLVLAGAVVVAGFGVQHAALLRRQMRFGASAAVDVSAHIAGVAAAVLSAQSGAGYWALVIFQLTRTAVATSGAWVACQWRPGRPTSFAEIRSLVSFGTALTAFNTLTHLTRNLDNIILGRIAGATALGFYTKAYSLLLVPVDRVRGSISAVVIPALSRLQSEPPSFRAYFLKAITTVAAVGMPIVVFLFVFADESVRLILGPQWTHSAPFFRLLAPAAFVETFNTIGSWVCIPMGRTARLVRWQTVATTVMVAAFFVGSRWGATGMAAAVSVATVALRAPAVVYLLAGSPIHPKDLAVALSRPAFASVTAGLAVYIVALTFPEIRFDGVLEFLGAAGFFSLVYVPMLFGMPGGKEHFHDVLVSMHALFPAASPRLLRPRGSAGGVAP